MLCTSHCACCQKHAVHAHSLQQRALDEINMYRKLLRMEPLTSMYKLYTDDAKAQPAPFLGSITRSAAIETMPPEVLDRIIQYVDVESIVSLCHAVPYYKYISAAMFEFGKQFPNEWYRSLWPDVDFDESAVIDFPIQQLRAAKAYLRIVVKYGGTVSIHSSMNLPKYIGALPDVLSVYPGDSRSCSVWAKFLCELADANKRIRTCVLTRFYYTGKAPFTKSSDHSDKDWTQAAKQLTRLRIRSLIVRYNLPDKVQEALPFISGLSYLEVDDPTDLHENNGLSRCLNLTEISFVRAPRSDWVGCILRRIKGSRIQKVWCNRPYQDSEVLEPISSEFLRHGWHMKGRAADNKWCFAYRQC
ncbi:hypothetical protein BJ741DRAFT_637942 [Chytriomyces cf. hyalinus JEL632]|nr:hypothetical protein BJ741DRAFT_637942 [Chytriomyces cf. hyalinus JEL632]